MNRILIVDDDEVTRTVLLKKLIDMGLEVNTISTGEECIKAVQQQQVDLILLDMKMPGKSGLDTLSELRQIYSHAELPIIMMTAEGDKDVATVNALQAGANDFISKPINATIAKARIDTQLKMVALHKQIITTHRLEAVNAMITTFNHEINNPLAIAMGLLPRSKLAEDKERYQKVMNALTRIKDIVIKIRDLQSHKLDFKDYTRDAKMIKLN